MMKCDELKPLVFSLNDFAYIDEPAAEKNFENPHDHAVYKATEVDAAIAELKQKLEDAKATAYAESVDAGMRERRLKRALWLARAERANESHFMWCQLIYDKKYGIVKFNVKKEWGQNIKKGQTLHTPQGWADVWEDVEHKCRAKAEEYK